MNRIAIIYIIVLALLVSGFTLLINVSLPPERLILGEWQETNWSYEMVDLPIGAERRDFLEEVKRSVGQGLIQHQAEKWVFLPDHRLMLTGEQNEVEARWFIKGRGHILHIIHPDGSKENYVVDQLDRNGLRLQFETDIQARGIASLAFSRLSRMEHRHAEKIQ